MASDARAMQQFARPAFGAVHSLAEFDGAYPCRAVEIAHRRNEVQQSACRVQIQVSDGAIGLAAQKVQMPTAKRALSSTIAHRGACQRQ